VLNGTPDAASEAAVTTDDPPGLRRASSTPSALETVVAPVRRLSPTTATTGHRRPGTT
jgi:hypothetical protein